MYDGVNALEKQRLTAGTVYRMYYIFPLILISSFLYLLFDPHKVQFFINSFFKPGQPTLMCNILVNN